MSKDPDVDEVRIVQFSFTLCSSQAQTKQLAVLTEKWTLATQDVLDALISTPQIDTQLKSTANGTVSSCARSSLLRAVWLQMTLMSMLLQAFKIDPAMVRYDAQEDVFLR